EERTGLQHQDAKVGWPDPIFSNASGARLARTKEEILCEREAERAPAYDDDVERPTIQRLGEGIAHEVAEDIASEDRLGRWARHWRCLPAGTTFALFS